MAESSNTEEAKKVESAASEEPKRVIVTIPLTRLLTSATRPIVTIMFAAVISQIVIGRITAPDWFVYGLAMPCILWWFGERAYRHSKERNGKV